MATNEQSLCQNRTRGGVDILMFHFVVLEFRCRAQSKIVGIEEFDTEFGPIGRCYEKRTENNSKYETQISVFVVICPVQHTFFCCLIFLPPRGR
jgi:hypothetical protein